MVERSHIRGLDGLRAGACLAVFAVHWQQITGAKGNLGPIELPNLLENGNTGVALFFLLSGLLLGLPYWRANADRPFSLPRYARTRAARILPAYYLCLTALVLVRSHWHSPQQLADTALHYVFLHNLAEFSIYSLSDPFWTIAVQVQFYALFPLLLLLTRPARRSPALGMGLLLALAAASYFAHRAVMEHYQPPQTHYVLSHSLLAHLPLFLMGFAAGPLMPRTGDPTRRRAAWDALLWLSAAGIIAVLGIPALDERVSIPHGRYNLPYVPLLLLAIILSAPRAPLAGAILEWPPVRLLGVISYGVYLYHLPCLRVLSHLMQRADASPAEHPALLAALGLALSITAAALSWIVLERPILRWSRGRAG